MKKILAIIFALVIIFSMSTSVFAAEGESDVSVAVNSANISVTLPLDITVTALVDGGSATVPENYQIVNASAIPVKVEKIGVTMNDTIHWAFKDAPIAPNAGPTTQGINDIYLSVNGQVLKVQGELAPTTSLSNWNINAGATKNLQLVCSTSMLNQTTTAADLITIKYVVSAGSYPTT